MKFTPNELNTFISIAMLDKKLFSLEDVTGDNMHRNPAAVRRELQQLRDKGLITFLGRGEYSVDFV